MSPRAWIIMDLALAVVIIAILFSFPIDCMSLGSLLITSSNHLPYSSTLWMPESCGMRLSFVYGLPAASYSSMIYDLFF